MERFSPNSALCITEPAMLIFDLALPTIPMSNTFTHGNVTLFSCSRIRHPECIKLIVPPGASLSPGQENWTANDAVEAYCLHCNAIFPSHNGSSASLRKHVLSKHPQDLVGFSADEQVEEKEDETQASKESSAKRLTSDFSLHEDEPIETSSVRRPVTKKKRTKRDEVLATIYSGDPTAMDLLIRWICGSLEPLSTVVESGFIDLIKFLSKGKVQLPDRETICRIVEHKAAEQRFETMRRVHQEVGQFSLSAEIWQSEYDSYYGREKYLVLLCHHVNTNFEPATFPLGVVNIEDGSVDEMVKNIFREWELSLNNASLLLSTNDKLVCQLAVDLKLLRFPDIWAVVQTSLVRWIRQPQRRHTTISNAETTQVNGSTMRSKHAAESSVALVVADLKKLADDLDYDWDVKRTLLRAQITGGDEESLKIRKTECDSWDEVYDFLTELMVWRPSINRFFAAADTAIAEPTAKMWFVAEALLLILRTLREVQQITTKEKARTIPFMVHCLVITKQQLNQEHILAGLIKHYRLTMEFDATDISQDLLMLQKSLLEGISSTFDASLSELLWCSLLDPRYAKMEHISEDQRELCGFALAERALELHRKNAPAPGLMHRLLQEEDVPDDAETEETRIYIADEISTYLTDIQQSRSRITDPFKWWRDNFKRYPFLSPLARVWLGTVGCSSAAIGGLRRQIPSQVTMDNWKYEESEDPWETMMNVLYLHVSMRKPKNGSS